MSSGLNLDAEVLARFFRESRARLGLTQAKLAREMGYADTSSVSKKERGATAVTPRDVEILKALKEARDGSDGPVAHASTRTDPAHPSLGTHCDNMKELK